MAERPSKRVFISHIATETDFAQYLKRRLETDFLGSLEIFVSSDQSSIGAGSRWLVEVEEALRNTDLQLILCSNDSVGRPWVNFEAGAVWLTGVPVVPVCHSGMSPGDLTVPLSFLQAISATNPKDLQRLYLRIAEVVGLHLPAVGFDELADEIETIERRHAVARGALEKVENPLILCAANEQYAEPQFGFDRDVAVLEEAFPGRVVVERALTRSRLLQLLTSQQFDIVHLVLPVEERTGDLIFSRIDPCGTPSAPSRAETLSPKGLADLLVESGASLVVLATCDALLLAVEVSHIANMAASDTAIDANTAVEWESCFYGLLAAGMSVYKAFDLAKSQTNAPMRHIRHRDVVFKRPS